MAQADTITRSDYLAPFDDPDLKGEERVARRSAQWKTNYAENVAEPLGGLVEKAQALGCDVRTAATLLDLSAAAREAKVVILYTHWKGGDFSNDDFLPGLEAKLQDKLAGIDDPLAVWLRAALKPQSAWMGLRRRPAMSAREALRRCLNSRIEAGTPCFSELASTTASRRREKVDLWLADCVKPGNRLELFDGLHDKEAIAAAMKGFAGILDLSACKSTFLGDYLGRSSNQSFRTVQFLEWQYPNEAALRAGFVLDAANGRADAYMAGRNFVACRYPELVRAELRKRGGNDG